MTTPAQIRRELIQAMRLSLIGPAVEHGKHSSEKLPTAPSRFYLTGFLIPYGATAAERCDESTVDDFETIAETDNRLDRESEPEPVSSRRSWFPSSMGLTVLLPRDVKQLNISVSWADYHQVPEHEGGHEQFGVWQRQVHTENRLLDVADHAGIPLEAGAGPRQGLELVTITRPAKSSSGQTPAPRMFSVYLVNHRPAVPGARRDGAYAFQARLCMDGLVSFVARPNRRDNLLDDPDEACADIQYRDTVAYAIGHNVSAAWEASRGGCRRVWTEWLPEAVVAKVDHVPMDQMQAGMAALGRVDQAAAAQAMLAPLLTGYDQYLQAFEADLKTLNDRRAAHGAAMLRDARLARGRIAAGLALLDDPMVFKAFRIANRAVAEALRRRRAVLEGSDPKALSEPTWRPFQIGFILMNLAGLFDPGHRDRLMVDLLFFPTGGGKTEAYLGLAAFAIVLRRLRAPGFAAGGVSVLMRYTLRLLTLDQLDRAAALVCALELERRDGPDRADLGDRAFEIGLWVGQGGTPNRMGKPGDNDEKSAYTWLRNYKANSRRDPPPTPLRACPWCGEPFSKDSYHLRPNQKTPENLVIVCTRRGCDFQANKPTGGLPILCVDEPIYRRLPCFIVATADKFAGLPWLAATGRLFGLVERWDDKGYYGPGKEGEHKAPALLPPPDLIIQDELHLISGPLGTMAGLYETAVEALCTHGGRPAPKIIASTATVRQAHKQIQALFARSRVAVFPPPGLDKDDNFFAKADTKNPDRGRLYLGVAAQGRGLKSVLTRVYLVLLAAAQKLWEREGGADNPDNPVDPYMTLLGYFNTLRELGGCRRIVEDSISSGLTTCDQEKRLGEAAGLLAKRRLRVPVELTSRERTDRVALAKLALAGPCHGKDGVDVALATNMISVGLDITRLGLMVVMGQPKAAAEYIQATSRVGRDDQRPGLVVALLNIHRPRDRSHYEDFTYWHDCFYRSVEATSVTPFSARALDRGLAAVTVALARHLKPAMTPPQGAGEIDRHRTELTELVGSILAQRVRSHANLSASDEALLAAYVKLKAAGLLDTWEQLARNLPNFEYQKELRVGKSLLKNAAGPESEGLGFEERKFLLPWSLRQVEPKVDLWPIEKDAVQGGDA